MNWPRSDDPKAVCIHSDSQNRFSLLFLRDFCPKTGSHFSKIALPPPSAPFAFGIAGCITRAIGGG
jgi:hypothetical protein